MKLQTMIKGIAIADRRGRFASEVTGVCHDSRAVRPGDCFVAVRGLTHDGHQHVVEATERGAVAVVVEQWSGELDDRVDAAVDVVIVPDTRRALGLVAANFYGQPSRKLLVAGVTGTNGKTTVTYVLESIVRAAGRSVGVVGSVEARYDERSIPLGHTTPGPVDLQRILAEMAEAEVGHVVMEVSSHALDQQRTVGVHFKVAAFTNLTRDHLDYHKTEETYFEAKARLFSDGLRRSQARGRMAVVSVDGPRGVQMLERWGGKSLRVSLDADSDADVVVLSADCGLDGTKAILRTAKGEWPIETSLVGPHNLSNICVAVGMALAMGFSRNPITKGIAALTGIPGRMERIPDPDRTAFVDYAHSPDALGKVLEALAPLTEGRLVVVFGAGGDRDRDKRLAMGEAVGARAQRVFLTSDNPRSEDPAAIAAELEAGLRAAGMSPAEGADDGFTVELDRQTAIRKAVEGLSPGDVLLVAGKGHEAVQIIEGKRYRFDDREVTARALAGEAPEAPQPLEVGDMPPQMVARATTETVGADDVLEVEDATLSEDPTLADDPTLSTETLAAAEAVAPSEPGPSDDEPPPEKGDGTS